ncbi:MAG: cytochrome P450 [Myxococcota bacterium]
MRDPTSDARSTAWTRARDSLRAWLGGHAVVNSEPFPGLGHVVALAADPLRLFQELAREHGGVAPLRLGTQRAWLVTEPAQAEEIFVTQIDRYSRRTVVYDALTDFLGRSILTSEGDDWRRHRRMVQPAFQRKRLAAFTETIARLTAEHVAQWRGELDVSEAMMRLTLQIVSETLLGTKTQHHADDIGAAVDAGQRHTRAAITRLFDLPEAIPTPARRNLARVRGKIDAIAYALIEARRAAGDDGADATSMLIRARDEHGAPLPPERIRNELITLLSAGHETTSNALTWTMMRLSQHPDVARRFHDEVDTVLGGRPPTLDDVPRLTFTRWLFDEVLRLHPPAWATGRIALQDHRLGDRDVRTDDVILISPYVTQRRPDLWTNPEGFDPARWEALSRRGALPPFTFFPFGGGRRKCVGESFAYLEAILILAIIGQTIELTLTGRPVVPSPQITLGVASGMWMTASPRPPS